MSRNRALGADVLGIVASHLSDYSDVSSFCDVSTAHRNIARKSVTLIHNIQPIPAKDIRAFSHLKALDAPLMATTPGEAADVATWVLSYPFAVEIICGDRVVLRKRFTANGVLELASLVGRLDLAKVCVDLGADDWNCGHRPRAASRSAMGAAAGHRNIIDFTVAAGKDADNWNWAMRNAARCGHGDIVRLCADHGADDWNQAMAAAAGGGHRELVEFFAAKGANYWNEAMAHAAGGGHRELVERDAARGRKPTILR